MKIFLFNWPFIKFLYFQIFCFRVKVSAPKFWISGNRWLRWTRSGSSRAAPISSPSTTNAVTSGLEIFRCRNTFRRIGWRGSTWRWSRWRRWGIKSNLCFHKWEKTMFMLKSSVIQYHKWTVDFKFFWGGTRALCHRRGIISKI